MKKHKGKKARVDVVLGDPENKQWLGVDAYLTGIPGLVAHETVNKKEESKDWTLTHAVTGRKVREFDSFQDCVTFATLLSKGAKFNDWVGNPPERVRAAYKKALEVFERIQTHRTKL